MAALMSVLVTGCGDGSADGDDGRPAGSDLTASTKPVHLAPGVVASVAGGKITRAELDRVYATRARGVTRRGSRSERRLRHAALVGSAMSQLIQSEATVQRARAAGVSVSAAEVDAALEGLRKPFPGPAQWREFLERTHQTELEIRDRLRLQLLNRRLYAHQGATPEGAAKAARISRQQLRARTRCRPGYVVALCANSPSKPTEAAR